MATTVMQSTAFRSIVAPILNVPFDGLYEQRVDEWKSFMRMITGTPRAYHEEPILAGFQLAPEVPDGTPFPYDQGGQLSNPRFIYKVWGLAYAMTEVLMEDGDHIRLGSIYSEHLARSLIETRETITANILNRGFNSAYLMPGGDGVPLFSASHPIVSGTSSNLLASAANMSQTSVEQMVIQMANAVDDTGRHIRIIPGKLIVSTSNMLQAEVILKSVLRSNDANNGINPVRSFGAFRGDDPVGVVSRLTSSVAWFVKASNVDRGLMLASRRKLKRGMEGDFGTDSMRYKASNREIPGWVNWRDMYASAGLAVSGVALALSQFMAPVLGAAGLA